ncbi:MAG: helix-turn-helix transcriptional regulator [Chloroflexi bacterium]|nr:helix-turn-helix transcriptional regulator [Chloroflexota bacterium]
MGKSYGLRCPIAKTLDLLGDRWTLLLVRDLLLGKTRFKEFAESLEGIPLNLLADRLRLLETQGIVIRDIYCQHPPRAEYTLTEKGKALGPVISSIATWGRHYCSPEEQSALRDGEKEPLPILG